ncbi:MAG: PilN domain-containing protein [Candidatus Muiribacteriota bacterium]
MKINLNLFPSQYRCEPRDYKAILFMIGSLFLAIVIISFFFIFKKVQFSRLEHQSRAPVEALQARKEVLLREKQSKETRINTMTFNEQKKNELNEEIKAFNEILRDFYWGHFLQKFEESVPDRIWVRNIVMERFPKVYLACEAADLFKPVEFVKTLELSPYFRNIILGKAEEDPSTKAIKFHIDFEIEDSLFKKGL